MKMLYFLIIPVAHVFSKVHLFDSKIQIVSSICYVIINLAMSYVICSLIKKCNIDSVRKSAIIVVFGILLDQFIKCFIYKFDVHFNIIGTVFKIKPTQNIHQNGMFNYFDIKLDTSMIVLFKASVLIMVVVFFVRLKYKNFNRNCAFLLYISAGIATLLDSLLWGYTLDYFSFTGFTCYDLKDFYVNVAAGLGILELFNEVKQQNSTTDV